MAIVASLGSALLLDHGPGSGVSGGVEAGGGLALTSAMVALAGVFGVVDILLFLRIADPHSEPKKHAGSGRPSSRASCSPRCGTATSGTSWA